MCGGTGGCAILGIAVGLSPRVRGNPARPRASPDCPGSIPACAGEPPDDRRRPPCPEVYPRVCGGTAASGGGVSECPGLSPRVRGNPPESAPPAPSARSIPACAGEPLSLVMGDYIPPVYPRVCGGTSVRCGNAPTAAGLSPRVRGNRRSARGKGCCPWSIPACAGEPDSHFGPLAGRRVYPRVCGGTPSPGFLTP